MSQEEINLVNYEAQISELESIVAKMEAREISLDEAMKSYEKGIHIIRDCQKMLNQAEQKIKILTQSPDGEEVLENIDSEDF